ncbi:hypothetical protein Hdeb2414_s0018g00536171 [Helianthus debilis subsp. tardiflorus]
MGIGRFLAFFFIFYFFKKMLHYGGLTSLVVVSYMQIIELAQSYPGLLTFYINDISPASWMSIAWYVFFMVLFFFVYFFTLLRF